MAVCHQCHQAPPLKLLFTPNPKPNILRYNLSLPSRTEPEPLLLRLSFPAEKELLFVVVSPEFEAPTKKMRAALPKEIAMAQHMWNSTRLGRWWLRYFRRFESDKIVEPKRARGATNSEGGAMGCTISGAVALTDNAEMGKVIGERMVAAFMKHGNLKAVGARLVSSIPR